MAQEHLALIGDTGMGRAQPFPSTSDANPAGQASETPAVTSIKGEQLWAQRLKHEEIA